MREPYRAHHVLGQDVYLETKTEYGPGKLARHFATLKTGNTVLFQNVAYSDGKDGAPDMKKCIELLWKDVDDFITQAIEKINAAGFVNLEVK